MDIWGVFTADTSLSAYGVARTSYYRDYEQFPYGSLEYSDFPKDCYAKNREKIIRNQTIQKQKEDCPFCKCNKKRILINYLRKRDRHRHHDSINEDDEEAISEENRATDD